MLLISRYNWPAKPQFDHQFGPSAQAEGEREPAFRLSEFIINFSEAFPNIKKDFLYTKSSHSSSLPCVHIYPDNLKVTFTSANPAKSQVGQFLDKWLSQDDSQLDFYTVEPIPENTLHIYICCHAARDQRCGQIGPALLRTVGEYLASPPSDITSALQELDIQCFGTSHVVGHAFAGNMIIYRQGWKQGIWYGRVSPCDVDDIFRETIVNKRIIPRYWRGGLPSGEWTQKEGITGEEAEILSETWQEEQCACQSSG